MAHAYELVTVTIPTGAPGLSAAFNVPAGKVPLAIYMPATWVAADISFQAGPKRDAAWQNLFGEDDAEVVIQAAQARYIGITKAVAARFEGIASMKVRSGTAATPVDQTASRVLLFVFGRLG